MLPVYRDVMNYVGRRLGEPVELIVGSSFAQLGADEIDVAFLCGLPYIQLMRQPNPPIELLAAPILRGDRYAGRPIYFSDVVVHHNRPFRAFADLHGCSWAYNDPDSHSGYNLTRFELVERGAPRGFFSRVIRAGFHQKALRLVANGIVDAAAIDSQVLEVERRNHPELLTQLRVIDSFGPSTIQPVVAARRLQTELKDDLRAMLYEIGNDDELRDRLASGCVERFEAITDAEYDDIRRMLARVELAGDRPLDW
jgi:phosphonate transport system substrate-binding protein